MNYEKARKIHSEICDKFLFNRENREAFAGDFENEENSSELIIDIFKDVFAVNIILNENESYSIELVSNENNLYITPIITFYELAEGDIASSFSNPIELQMKKRPIEIGSSIGPQSEDWQGTLGCIVKDLDNGEKYLLSNYHVLYSPSDPNYNFILQPAVISGGTTDDAIGMYIRALVPELGTVNEFDAAIAGPIAIDIMHEIPSINQQIAGLKTATIGMKVYKIGVTSSLTYGVIAGIDSSLKVKNGNDMLEYNNQIYIKGTQADFTTPGNFSLAGDSGSIVLEYGTNALLGLLFCGNNAERSFANKIEPLFDSLRITL